MGDGEAQDGQVVAGRKPRAGGQRACTAGLLQLVGRQGGGVQLLWLLELLRRLLLLLLRLLLLLQRLGLAYWLPSCRAGLCLLLPL